MNVDVKTELEAKADAKVQGSAAESQLPRVMVADDSEFSALLDSAKFTHLWKVAKVFAASRIVPEQYQGSPETCMIAIAAAVRLRLDPLMFLQRTYVVGGKPGMEAQLVIALVNKSGLFSPLSWAFTGDQGSDSWKCICSATRKSTGEVCDSEISWEMVKAEGWLAKNGSKWKTMPTQMFRYRTATFFARLHCPEVLIGFNAADEVEDIQNRRAVETTGRVVVTPDPPTDPDADLPDEPDDAGVADVPEAWRTAPEETDPKALEGVIGTVEASKFWPAYRKRYNRDEKPLRAWLASHGYASSKAVKKCDFETMFRDLT